MMIFRTFSSAATAILHWPMFLLWMATTMAILSKTAFASVDRYPFLMPGVQPQEPDSYFCTAVEVESGRTSYIVAFEPNATAATAHHILIYGCKEPGSREEVWECGEMTGKTTKNKLKRAPVCSKAAQVIYAWAHDAPKLILPKGVGFKIGAGSKINYLVLQVHYADVKRFVRDHDTDYSGIVITTTYDKMPKAAGVYLLGTRGLIFPRSKENMETACRIEEDVKLHPFAFRTHTHALGKLVTGYMVRKNGMFDFNPKWTLIGKKNPQLPQMFYPVDKPDMVIQKGDILAARCNMVSNRRRITRIGPTSDDEMCNFYIMYWVDGDKTLEQQYCFSLGPPIFYWKRVPLLFNIPDANAGGTAS